MLSISTILSVIEETLRNEHNALLQTSENGIYNLPEPALAYIVGREVQNRKKEILGDVKVEWIIDNDRLKQDSKALLFHIDGKAYVISCRIYAGKEHLQNTIKDLPTFNIEGGIVCVLSPMASLKNVALQSREGMWEVAEAGASSNLAESGKSPLYLHCWELNSLKQDAPALPDAIAAALNVAVRNMELEAMLLALSTVISLRINLAPEKIEPDTRISQLIKMVFAQEQGVTLAEVYDPIALAGLTDSQLAAGNLITDLQRAFGLKFTSDEVAAINTVKDLAFTILSYKSSLILH